MENLIKDIQNIITESNNQINDKILGVNYLERLKYLLIDKLKNFKINSKENIESLQNKEIKNQYNQKKLFEEF